MKELQHGTGADSSGIGPKDGGGVAERKEAEVEIPETPTCVTCRAWVPIMTQHAEIGRCHRRPPQVVHGPETDTIEGYTDSVWPETAPDEFCCDFLPKEEPR